jgi:ribosomal protein L17
VTDLPPQKLHELRNDVIPLEAAAALAYDRIYIRSSIDETPTWKPSDARNAVAHAMASITPLYIATASNGGFRRLTKDDLRSGEFQDAGAVLQFSDGRPEISGLLVQSSRVAEAIAQLQLMRGLLNELAKDYCARRR